MSTSTTTMNFADAVRMSEDPVQGVLRTTGENGHPSLTVTGQGYTPLAYFEKLVRDLSEERHVEFINDICREAEFEGAPARLADLFLTMFQTRDCRGGKGDKLPFYRMMKLVYAKYPATILLVAECIPFYGYWKDPLLLIREIHDNPVEGIDYSPLIARLYSLMATQLQEDNVKLQEGSYDLTFMAKYAPRQGHEFDRTLNSVSEFCKRMYPEIVGDHLLGKPKKQVSSAWNKAKSQYRKLVARLTSALEVPEVFMCGNRWAEINFARVTSLCLNRNTKAFLNESKDGSVRCPDSDDRIQCAKNVISKIGDLKGKMVFPHELVQKIMKGGISKSQELVYNAQWTTIRESVVEMTLQIAKECEAKEGESKEDESSLEITLASLVAMCDVSGSMSGLPMEVAIALSILLSELTHESFRDLILSFSSDPVWEDLKGCSGLVQKVQKLQKSNWGMSTDFYKAMSRIASVVEENGITEKATPGLVVFSDMQFDSSLGYTQDRKSWDTMHERIVKMFSDLGIRMDGEPRLPPNIVYWNLRSDTVDYPAAADQTGVATMSGYSPALMKFFLSGQLMGETVEEVDEETGEIKLVVKQITPLESFKKVLADSRLDMIRCKLAESDEGLLAGYTLE